MQQPVVLVQGHLGGGGSGIDDENGEGALCGHDVLADPWKLFARQHIHDAHAADAAPHGDDRGMFADHASR